MSKFQKGEKHPKSNAHKEKKNKEAKDGMNKAMLGIAAMCLIYFMSIAACVYISGASDTSKLVLESVITALSLALVFTFLAFCGYLVSKK